MSLRSLFCCSALLWGCAHAPLPNSAPHPAPGAAKQSADSPSNFELPLLGLRLRAPGPMAVFEHEIQAHDGPVRTTGATCTVNSQEYSVTRLFREGRNRATDDVIMASAKSNFKTVSREAPLRMAEWQGVQLEGTNKRERLTRMRLYVMGDGFWIAQVQRTAGSIDEAAASEFLDSIVLTQPWSVHAYPEGHFSALMPDGGVNVDRKALGSEDFLVAEGSLIGGSEMRSFYVFELPLADNGSTPDERMDRALSAITDAGGRVIWQAPVDFDAARGRDFLVQDKALWMRLRFIVTSTDLYMMQAVARTKEGLADKSVPRFLASLRWH